MPYPTFCFRGFALATAVGLLCAAGVANAVDIEADWQQRKSAAGVFYSNTFDYASKAELLATGAGHTDKPPAAQIDLDTAIKLSGSKSLKIITATSAGGNGGSWADWYDGLDGKTKWHQFYFQFSVYLPRATLAYRSQGGDGQLKLANLEQYGNSQVVVGHKKFMGFPSIALNGNMTVERTIQETVVPNVNPEYVYQPAVDAGGAAPGNACEFWARYGPSRGVTANDDYGTTNPEPRLDRRNLTYGWPNRCALQGGVPFNIDGWTTVEVHVDFNPSSPAQSTVQAWAAPYGQAPRLFVNEVGTAPLKTSDDVYHRFELLNYDTPRESEANRPTMYTYFDEVVISTQPIKFPGGFSLPSTTVRPNPPTSVTAQ